MSNLQSPSQPLSQTPSSPDSSIFMRTSPSNSMSSTNSDSSSNSRASENPFLIHRRSKKKEKPPGCRSKWSVASTSERLLWLIITPFRAVFCVSNVTLFFLTYFGFMVPVLWAKPLWPRFYWFYEGKLYMWLQSFIGYWGYTADYDGSFCCFYDLFFTYFKLKFTSMAMILISCVKKNASFCCVTIKAQQTYQPYFPFCKAKALPLERYKLIIF